MATKLLWASLSELWPKDSKLPSFIGAFVSKIDHHLLLTSLLIMFDVA